MLMPTTDEQMALTTRLLMVNPSFLLWTTARIPDRLARSRLALNRWWSAHYGHQPEIGSRFTQSGSSGLKVAEFKHSFAANAIPIIRAPQISDALPPPDIS